MYLEQNSGEFPQIHLGATLGFQLFASWVGFPGAVELARFWDLV